MNNYFNFTIPKFNSEYGEDWGDFNDITEDQVDYAIQKIIDLYKLNDITMTPLIATEYIMKLLGIEIYSTDSLAIKKYKIRKYNTNAKAKATLDLYLDYAENIVGTRGEIYNGYYYGAFIQDESSWPDTSNPTSEDWVWAGFEDRFYIYIDVKTTDSGELDEIQDLYQQDHLLPAFYQVYLIDSSFNILRTI
ncbi:MAG: hypothetical protein ACFFG0_02500 [Candidatus Thorarchaeota archaeon]